MFRFLEFVVTLPDFPKLGLSENWLESNMADSPDFIVPKFGVTDLPIFVFTLPDFQEISSKKSADSKNTDHGIEFYLKLSLAFTCTFIKANCITNFMTDDYTPFISYSVRNLKRHLKFLKATK